MSRIPLPVAPGPATAVRIDVLPSDTERGTSVDSTTVANTLVPFQGKWLLYYGGADRHIGLAMFTPGD